MSLLRYRGLEQCDAGGGPSLLQLLSRDAGGRKHHQRQAHRQPAGQVRAVDEILSNTFTLHCVLTAFLLYSKIKENKNASEIIKTVNMLVSCTNSEYLWDYMTRRFCNSLRYGDEV